MYRTVFNLYAIEGYEHQEISDLLGISVGTSKSNLHRARLKLRSMLTVGNHEKQVSKMNDKELDDFFKKLSSSPEIPFVPKDWDDFKKLLPPKKVSLLLMAQNGFYCFP